MALEETDYPLSCTSDIPSSPYTDYCNTALHKLAYIIKLPVVHRIPFKNHIWLPGHEHTIAGVWFTEALTGNPSHKVPYIEPHLPVFCMNQIRTKMLLWYRTSNFRSPVVQWLYTARICSTKTDRLVNMQPVCNVRYLLCTRNFTRYVNYMDFAANRAAVKLYSVNILPLRIFKVGSVWKCNGNGSNVYSY